jgi:hypothetical protein
MRERMSLKDYWSKPASEQDAIAEKAIPKIVNPCIRVIYPSDETKQKEGKNERAETARTNYGRAIL